MARTQRQPHRLGANPRHAARIRAVGSWLRRLSVLALEADGRAAARPSVMDALEREADVRPRVQLRQLTGGVESPGPEVVGTPANGRVDASCHLAGRWATGVRWRRDTDEAATRQRSADSSAGRTTRAQPS